MAVVFESSGEVATVFELDKFKSWEEWKLSRIKKREVIKEIPIDREISKEIQKIGRKFFRRD